MLIYASLRGWAEEWERFCKSQTNPYISISPSPCLPIYVLLVPYRKLISFKLTVVWIGEPKI